MRYTYQDIVNSLKELLNPTDTVFFSTSLGMVGIPPSFVKSLDELNKLFLDAIREVLHSGTILVPTYSYTFGKSLASNLAVFDPKETPAEIGPFPNYVLRQKEVFRSLDPFMSVACIGKRCKEFLDDISNISYGKNSVFERLVSKGAKCVSIGLGPNWTPFIHYADYLAKVPHRYDKLFWGYIKIDSKLIKTPWIYSVRFVGDESYPYAHIAGREAEKKGIWEYRNLGRARVYMSDCKEYFDFVMKRLSKNSWYLAKGPAVDVIAKEKERVKYQEFGDENYVTGEWLGDNLIPERWGYSEAKLIDSKGEVISTTPWIHSLSVDKILSKDELLPHISEYQKNCFFNRDFGFVVKEKLKDEKYRVIIKSEFGKGKVKVKNGFLFAESWEELRDVNLKRIVGYGGIRDV